MSSLDCLEDDSWLLRPSFSLKRQATTVNLGIIFLVAFCATIGIAVLLAQPHTPNFAFLGPRLARVGVWSWDNRSNGFLGNGTIDLQEYLGGWIPEFV
jgi:hypothetical protein